MLPVARGLVLLWQCSDMLCISGFMDEGLLAIRAAVSVLSIYDIMCAQSLAHYSTPTHAFRPAMLCSVFYVILL